MHCGMFWLNVGNDNGFIHNSQGKHHNYVQVTAFLTKNSVENFDQHLIPPTRDELVTISGNEKFKDILGHSDRVTLDGGLAQTFLCKNTYTFITLNATYFLIPNKLIEMYVMVMVDPLIPKGQKQICVMLVERK